MASTLKFKFSHPFEGTVWSTLAVLDNILILEIRNENRREVRFSAFDYSNNKFLWRDIIFEEAWWIGLTAATSEVVLLHHYHSTSNPDDKGLIAWHIYQRRIVWKLDHFSFHYLENGRVFGQFIKEDGILGSVEVLTGEILKNVNPVISSSENIILRKPFQYAEGTEHFETVKTFLTSRLIGTLVGGVEYLEDSGLIFISYHVQQESLANYLVVLTEGGHEVLFEKIDWQLKGIGVETFFLLSGCLFFVRNKVELVSYKLV